MDKIDIKSLSKEELGLRLEGLGAEAYRSRQIFKWIYVKLAKSFDDMTDIPVGMRDTLKKNFYLTRMTALDSKCSKLDGTTKYLFSLEDGNTIEAVFLPEGKRGTICLSSQVGCKYGCSFCASAPFGFVRNLTTSEILDEVIHVKAAHPKDRITNLVFMGIGEPMDNYSNVLEAIRIFNDPGAFNIGARRITISTCGIIPGIERLQKEGLQVELSVSLHSAKNDVRSSLVPINKKYPVKDLIAACKDYTRNTGRVITFEYVMIKGENSSKADSQALVDLLGCMKCKVNVISYNPVRSYGRTIASNGASIQPSSGDIRCFIDVLKKSGVNVTKRKSKGEEIDAGCGQLRISKF
ncbi:MAG: 23S rRNA (adenine(2503)-C(2))-methyltransferase RlmN [Candidatus Omnitrophica bacterium]|nr:23S rRNA (adenine(2503)-C(2))-methyltransferase RlmN [Candidatus Omnitrophota bacterium]